LSNPSTTIEVTSQSTINLDRKMSKLQDMKKIYVKNP